LFIFHAPNASHAFLVLGHKHVEGGLWELLWLAPLVLLPWAILWTFWLDHPRRPFFSYDDILALGRLGVRWHNQDLLPIELDRIHVCRERVLVEFYLGTLCKFQSSFVYG
jgi:hypothetical protein